MYDIALRFAEGNPAIAAFYLAVITLGMMGLAAYHQNTLTSWSRSTFFWLTVVWSVAVLFDVIGLAPWINQGLPQITRF